MTAYSQWEWQRRRRERRRALTRAVVAWVLIMAAGIVVALAIIGALVIAASW